MKTIELTQVRIIALHINYDRQVVEVEYELQDELGHGWQRGNVLFWVTMPDIPPGKDEIPDNWFQLPASYLPELVKLRDDAKTAIENKYLSGAG